MAGEYLQMLLDRLNVSEAHGKALEILGGKGLSGGHIDLLIKERVPLGSALRIPVEVKTNDAKRQDISQLEGYMEELRGECPIGILVAADFSSRVITQASQSRIRLVRYTSRIDLKQTPTFREIYESLAL
jgi:RecB family endonuclease NucS